MSLNAILVFDKSQDDFYQLLGCDELSSMEQISTEFKQKALKFHPDKNKDNPNSSEMFAKLQRAKEVLTDPDMRMKYDGWRRSGLLVPFDLWLSRQMSPSLHWATERRKEPMLEEATRPSQVETSQVETTQATAHHDSGGWVRMPAKSGSVLSKFRNYQI